MRKNTQLAAILGTLVGGLIGSTGTILVFKKLDKLEHKKDLEAEAEHIAEVAEMYEARIKRLKDLKISGGAAIEKTSDEIVNEKAKEAHNKVTVNNDTEEEPKITNPKFVYQDKIAEEMKETKPHYDYSKISKEKYTDLKKEYEREPIVEEGKFPHIITQDSYEHAAGYVKEEVMYYEQNGIFATLDDEIVDHLTEEYFGLDNLSLFGTEQASLDHKSSLYELYLRDEELHIDYHIIYNGTEDFDHLGDCR